jgi:mono/diheme cytochrome c family protein
MRRHGVGITLFIAAAIFATGTARAQDIVAGKAIAQVWCSNCHHIGPQEKTIARDAVPTFLSIAKMKSTTEMSLAAFLTTPHGGMPNLTLSRKEIQDVSSYILSLSNQP